MPSAETSAHVEQDAAVTPPRPPALTGDARRDAEAWLARATEVARSGSCLRSRCGAVIVADGVEIGAGYNSLPGDCVPTVCFKDQLPDGFRSDRTCCIHAEARAIFDAVRRHGGQVDGATLYFARVDDAGRFTPAGDPYCTMCSKAALEARVETFVLGHADGPVAYPTDEYNLRSFGLWRGQS